MAVTTLPSGTDADIARVTEALDMITPRWNVRILLALSGAPLRYHELADKLSWLQSGQLHPKVRSLCDAGLVERTEHAGRHVTYGPTDRAVALLPVLPQLVTWAERYLEKPDQPLPAIEQIEDSLTLLNRRHAAAILWVLKERGESSGRALASTVMPGRDLTNVYHPLRQLVADGLVETVGLGRPYRLSAAGEGLGPVLASLSAWSVGQPLVQADRHPVWGRPQTPPATERWVSNTPRLSAPTTGAGQSSPLTWQRRDLFSHPTPPRPKTALSTGGPRR